MPSRKTPKTQGAIDQGANLTYRVDAISEVHTVVRLPNSRVGIECPTVLHASGPVFVTAEREIYFHAELRLDLDALRFKVHSVGLSAADEAGEIDPELLRQIRWGEIFAGAVGSLSNIVTVDDSGAVTTHRGAFTLSPEEQVGGLWLQARLAGLDPNTHIAAQFNITNTAAAARVKRARDHKTIPPATQGQRR